MRDLTGNRFGRWVVLRFAYCATGYRYFWVCRCDCGVEREINAQHLLNKGFRSCGCEKRLGSAIDGAIKVPLTRGKFAVVSVEDEWVCDYKWRAKLNKGGHWYAIRSAGPVGRRTNPYLHRAILNVSPDAHVDHTNGDGLDNKRENLRVVTRNQNMWNTNGHSDSSSRFKGVSWFSKNRKWVARISKAGRRFNLGVFKCEIEAALVYDYAAARLFGSFAKLNFPLWAKIICRED
jgi:hypothetical protein